MNEVPQSVLHIALKVSGLRHPDPNTTHPVQGVFRRKFPLDHIRHMLSSINSVILHRGVHKAIFRPSCRRGPVLGRSVGHSKYYGVLPSLSSHPQTMGSKCLGHLLERCYGKVELCYRSPDL